MTTTKLTTGDARAMEVGRCYLYGNEYGQLFNAKLVRKHLTEDGRVFLAFKRLDWAGEEVFSADEFARTHHLVA